MEATNRCFAVLACAAAICVGSTAQAQANPELGDTGEGAAWAPPAAAAEGSASASASASTSGEFEASGDSSGDSSPSASPSGSGAHADAVGRFGIGFFGVIDLPICLNVTMGGGCDVNPGGVPAVVQAPAIGLRYWLNETIGIEGALGIGISSGTETVDNGMGEDENLDVSTTGFLLHGAVPIALAYNGNFVFQVVPELNFGITSGTIYDNAAGPGMTPNDVDISGMLFQLGGRAGAEIHFGFIGLPQLSLQGTVGLHITLASRSASIGSLEVSRTSTRIGTTVQDDPWDIFTGNITAIYYFMD